MYLRGSFSAEMYLRPKQDVHLRHLFYFYFVKVLATSDFLTFLVSFSDMKCVLSIFDLSFIAGYLFWQDYWGIHI